MLNSLYGEEITDEWELVDDREFNEENESIEEWANSKIKEKLSIVQKLANVVKSKPNGFSYLDKSFIRFAINMQRNIKVQIQEIFAKQ